MVTSSCAGRELTLHLPLPGEAAAVDLTAALAAQEAVSREMLSGASIERALASVRLAGRGAVRTLAASLGVEVVRCTDTAAGAAVATERAVSGDAVLVKGSRSTGTEAVAAALERRER